MGNEREILIGIAGFMLSIYGGVKEELLFIVTGLLVILLNIYLIVSEQQNDLDTLKRQMNTNLEIKKIWHELEKIKDGRKKQ